MRKSLTDFFKQFELEHIGIDIGIAKAKISFKQADKNAAWDMYVEMLTRIVTQPLPSKSGDEQAALISMYSLFETTRNILHKHGRKTIHFSKVAIPVLNQLVRPFTTKWHQKSLAGEFDDPNMCQEFRNELTILLKDMRNYNRMLANIAGVEDLTDMEQLEKEKH